jgi:hypothetical protein
MRKRHKLNIKTSSFEVPKQGLRIFRVIMPRTAILLWLSEKQAIQYLQRLHIYALMGKNKPK